MTYDEFERRLLKIVFEEQKESFTPSFLAYKLQVPHTTIKEHLDQALADGIVELSVEEDGKLSYSVPGFDPNARLVRQQSLSQNLTSTNPYHEPPQPQHFHHEAQREVDQIAPNAPAISPQHTSPATTAHLPAIVDDATDIAHYQPRYSLYIRKIRVVGDFTKTELSGRISQFATRHGYQSVPDPEKRLQPDNDLYKRGSFLFILSLIPLFLMLLPLIAYAIMYAAGHSTLKSEPMLMEVGIQQLPGNTPVWEITLTYRGLHGIIFGKPDRELLNLEVEMLEAALKHP